jgi:hypothetical protein
MSHEINRLRAAAAAAAVAIVIAIATSATAETVSTPAPAGSGVGAVVELLVLQQALFYRYVLGLPPFGPSAEADDASTDAGPMSLPPDASDDATPALQIASLQLASIDDASPPATDGEVDAGALRDALVTPEDDGGSVDADDDWIGASFTPASAGGDQSIFASAAGAIGSRRAMAPTDEHHTSGAALWFGVSGIGGLGILVVLAFARARTRRVA